MTTLALARKLNAHMNLEFSASHLFLSLSNWCMERNHPQFAYSLRRQAQSCITHTMRVFDHLKKMNRHPIIKPVKISHVNITSFDALIKNAYDNQLLRAYELECLTEEARINIDTSTILLLEDIYLEQQDNNSMLKQHALEKVLSTRLLATC